MQKILTILKSFKLYTYVELIRTRHPKFIETEKINKQNEKLKQRDRQNFTIFSILNPSF